jgi:hypothetical protein
MLVAVDGGRDLVLHTTPPYRRWRRLRAPKTVLESGRPGPATGAVSKVQAAGDITPW